MSDSSQAFYEYCAQLRSACRPNKRVLFIELPQFLLSSFNLDVARKRGYYCFPPTGLQYLYEAVKRKNLEFAILDLNLMVLKSVMEDESFDHRQWPNIAAQYLDEYDPFIVGIGCKFDSSIGPFLQILELAKNRGKRIVVTGGVIPTYEHERLLTKQLCHFVVEGEGEDRINYLLDMLTAVEQTAPAVRGIHFMHGGRLYETDGKQTSVNFDRDLVDSYSLIPIEHYYLYGSLNPFSRMAGVETSPFTAIQMSRGCRGRCSFCSVRAFMGTGVRKRAVSTVLREMEYLVTERGIKHFEWLDDDLLFYKKDFQELLKAIIERKWDITWSANNGLIALSLDEETLGLMRDSGCIGFKIGIETGNPDLLRSINKPASLNHFRKVSQRLAQFPAMFVGGNYIVGFPGEKFHQMMDTFRFSLEMDLDWSAFTICQAIRGAAAFEDFPDYFASQINSMGQDTKNFIPVRNSTTGQISNERRVLEALNVFRMDFDCVPNEDQIREIWFTFNLVGNYINNKNLKPDGRIDKFIAWVEMAQLAYPTNPYMSLFLSLAHLIDDNEQKAEECVEKARQHMNSDYWHSRLIAFRLLDLVNDPPRNKYKVFEALNSLRSLVSAYYQ